MLLGFEEFDRDRERELFLDAARELLDEEREELRDLEPDLERCECAGDCEPSFALVSVCSGERDFERDLDLLLPPSRGEADPFGEGDLDGDLEYDLLELALEQTEAGDPFRTGDD